MKLDESQLEWIVQEVVRRLNDAQSAARQQPRREAIVAPVTTRHTLSLADRVITTHTLMDSLAGVRMLEVLPRAIVTPAARDLLRDADVELVRVEQAK